MSDNENEKMRFVADTIIQNAYRLLPSEEFERMLRILDYWDKMVMSNRFAKYEIINLTSVHPRLCVLVEQYFEYCDYSNY